MSSNRSLVLCAIFSMSCGSGFTSFREMPPQSAIAPGSGGSGADIQAFADRFYAPDAEPNQLSPELERLLAAHPSNATVHEMAAELAELREDSSGAWQHWLAAAADLDSPFASI